MWTTGKIYWSVLHKERHGDYGGGTVQVIRISPMRSRDAFTGPKHLVRRGSPSLKWEGQQVILRASRFLEAIRQFQHDVGHENAVLIHVTLIPY